MDKTDSLLKKNVLFYFTWQLRPVHHGIIIEKLKAIADDPEIDNVYFLTCSGSLKPCYTNREGIESFCHTCRFNTITALKTFKNKVIHLTIEEFNTHSIHGKKFAYDSVDSIKELKYKMSNIGYGALSSYISFTRNLEPAFNKEFKYYFDTLIENQVRLTDTLLELITSKKINQVYFFNGRTADTRPLYDICKALNISFTSLEMISVSDTECYVNSFQNCLPHDIEYHHSRMIKTWDESKDDETTKIKTGSSFFENRLNGVLTRDRKVYTNEQVMNKLPFGWDKSKRNIVIFNSSEDEFAAIGDIFESKALFPSQELGIRAILKHFENNKTLHFYLRIHPNLKDVNYSYNTRLLELASEFQNLTVIPPDSDISSYALMNATEKLIVFGSSIGAEATFSGKPVILLAGSFYYYLDIAYKPVSKEELVELLLLKLLPKSKLEAIKYGYYMMNYVRYTTLNTNSPVPLIIAGKQIGFGHQHLKILGSKLIFRIVEKSISFIYFWENKVQYTIPRTEKSEL